MIQEAAITHAPAIKTIKGLSKNIHFINTKGLRVSGIESNSSVLYSGLEVITNNQYQPSQTIILVIILNLLLILFFTPP